MPRFLAAAVLLCLLAAGAPAQSAQPSVPRDDREKWQLGVAALEGFGLSAENSYLANAVPLLIRDALARLPWHDLSEEERAARRKALIVQELATLAQSIGRLRRERDEAFFEGPGTWGTARPAAPSGLAGLVERRRYLESLDPLLIEVPACKALSIVDGPGAGRLFDPPEVSRGSFCRERGLDMLIGGSIREVQGFLLLDLWAWDAARAAVLFTWREAGRREELYDSLASAQRGLVEPVLGGPWSSLLVSLTPALARLSVDGQPAAPAGPGEIFLAPATHEVRATAPGYSEIVQRVDLAAGESKVLSMQLERLDHGTTTIDSDPAGADIYVNSLWTGKTPLALELPAERSRILLAKGGFLALPFSIGPSTPARDAFTLEPMTASRDALQRKARNGFYSAFGWFLLSLPAPLFCYRYAFDYAVKAQDLYTDGRVADAQRAIDQGTALYWTSVGGAVASASLFAWVVSAVVRYIAVSDRAAG